jgi:hypothetical protein
MLQPYPPLRSPAIADDPLIVRPQETVHRRISIGAWRSVRAVSFWVEHDAKRMGAIDNFILADATHARCSADDMIWSQAL